MEKKYDLIIIGTGPAGRTAIAECQSAQLKMAVIESREYGGTCTLRGCNPKKVLTGSTEVVSQSADLEGKGIKKRAEIDWPELIRFKRSFTEGIPEAVEKEYKDAGIDTYHGTARFNGKNSVRVGEDILTGKHIFIGSGAVPRPLKIEGDEQVITSAQFMELDALPKSVLFVGGGYISLEFGHVAARAGAKVVILEMTDRFLTKFDQDLVSLLVEASKKIGIEFYANTPVKSVEKSGKTCIVHAGKDGEKRFEAGVVVHGAGRVPDLDHLQLDQAEVDTSPKGIVVNEYMQSVSNPSVYAAGDAVATPFLLTPTATYEARIAAHNLIQGNRMKAHLSIVPSAVYTSPTLASVGMSEAQLKQDQIGYKKKVKHSFSSSRRIGLEHSGAKILLEDASNRILGAHLLLPRAEEIINILALAMHLRLDTNAMQEMVWTFPSFVYDIKELFD